MIRSISRNLNQMTAKLKATGMAIENSLVISSGRIGSPPSREGESEHNTKKSRLTSHHHDLLGLLLLLLPPMLRPERRLSDSPCITVRIGTVLDTVIGVSGATAALATQRRAYVVLRANAL